MPNHLHCQHLDRVCNNVQQRDRSREDQCRNRATNFEFIFRFCAVCDISRARFSHSRSWNYRILHACKVVKNLLLSMSFGQTTEVVLHFHADKKVTNTRKRVVRALAEIYHTTNRTSPARTQPPIHLTQIRWVTHTWAYIPHHPTVDPDFPAFSQLF